MNAIFDKMAAFKNRSFDPPNPFVARKESFRMSNEATVKFAQVHVRGCDGEI
jgi:hypothetical protein